MKKLLPLLLCLLLLLSLPLPATATEPEVTLLLTHDIHSHLEEWQGHGGMARLKTLIDANRSDCSFLLDGGDFSMGTLYQSTFESHAGELSMLGRLGYDATTIGNHEFDYQSAGFAGMLRRAKANAEADPTLRLPALLNANIDWRSSTDAPAQNLKQALDAYGSSGHAVIDRGGVRLGVFGLMGKDSQACAPMSGVQFLDCVEAAKAEVAALKAEGAELIVALSHSGTWSDPKRSEDELLAKAVPEIDVILSGHTHTALQSPIVHGSTYIVSTGEYGQNLGVLRLRPSGERWQLSDYRLLPTDANVSEDAAVLALLEEYRDNINNHYLSHFGYSMEQVLCRNAIDFAATNAPDAVITNWGMGDLLADALFAAVRQAEGEAHEPPALALVPTGVIRSTLPLGPITVADAFSVLSLGVGEEGLAGYPLVSVYLTGRELLNLAEVDASVPGLMDGAKLYVSGGGWEYNRNRLLLNRATEVWLYDGEGQKLAVEPERLYRVVADRYSAEMLGAVKSSSFGLLSLNPKDKTGQPVTDFGLCSVTDGRGKELKAWVALASYLQGFGGEDGSGEIPGRYAAASDRIQADQSKTLGALLKRPGKVFWLLCAAALLALLLIGALVLLLRRRKHRKKRRPAEPNG